MVSILPLLMVGLFLINFKVFLQDIIINTSSLNGSFDIGVIWWSFEHGIHKFANDYMALFGFGCAVSCATLIATERAVLML
jgi:hypothetical protein